MKKDCQLRQTLIIYFLIAILIKKISDIIFCQTRQNKTKSKLYNAPLLSFYVRCKKQHLLKFLFNNYHSNWHMRKRKHFLLILIYHLLFILTIIWLLHTLNAEQNLLFQHFFHFFARFWIKNEAKMRQKCAFLPYSQMLVDTKMLV